MTSRTRRDYLMRRARRRLSTITFGKKLGISMSPQGAWAQTCRHRHKNTQHTLMIMTW